MMCIKRCIVLLLVLFNCVVVYAQSYSKAKILSTQINKLHNLSEKDSLFKLTLKSDPTIKQDTLEYDNIVSSLAMYYASMDNRIEVKKYLSLIENKKSLFFHYFKVARSYYPNNIDESITNLNKSFELSKSFLINHEDPEFYNMAASSMMASSAYFLSDSYVKKKDINKAIKVIDTAMKYVSFKNGTGLLQNKGDILYNAGNYSSALNVYISLIKRGNESDGLKNKIKTAYIKSGFLETHYGSFFDSISNAYHQKFEDSINQFSSHIPAPKFKFKDSTGRIVQLSDYKGKIIVLDFWATWCGPCVASFPMMREAVNHFKNDRSVVFLFVDTWEYADHPESNVLQFLHDGNYNFDIMFDIKDSTTKEYINVKKFGIDGIPAKFVIDKDGFIRYKLKGFSGDLKSSVYELGLMINNARK